MTTVAIERRPGRPNVLAKAWAFVRRHVLTAYSILFFVYLLLPIAVPVLPLQTAIRHQIVKGRSDYQDELGWPALARQVERLAPGSDVVLASNYGEAGALELFGHALTCHRQIRGLNRQRGKGAVQ